jgi:hypothetical protein
LKNSEDTKWGKAVFQAGQPDSLTLQDSFTVIALYAAQVDPEDCQADVHKITALLPELDSEHDPAFAQDHKYMKVTIRERNVLLDDVNNFINDV